MLRTIILLDSDNMDPTLDQKAHIKFCKGKAVSFILQENIDHHIDLGLT